MEVPTEQVDIADYIKEEKKPYKKGKQKYKEDKGNATPGIAEGGALRDLQEDNTVLMVAGSDAPGDSEDHG